MKVFFGVLALAAVAAAGMVVEQPTVQPMVKLEEQHTVQPDETFPPKLDLSTRKISFYNFPKMQESQQPLEAGKMKKILYGPVMVAFKDEKEDKMSAYLLPKGLKSINNYHLEDVKPLVRYLVFGGQKAFMTLSAATYLQLPEMSKLVTDVHFPSYDLNTAFHIQEHNTPYPYILVVGADYIKANSRFEKLKEVGVFGFEAEGLKIEHDYYPTDSYHDKDLDEIKSFSVIVPVDTEESILSEYVKPVYTGKDYIPYRYYAAQDEIPKYINYGKSYPFVEYVKPYGPFGLRDSAQYKPVYEEKDSTAGIRLFHPRSDYTLKQGPFGLRDSAQYKPVYEEKYYTPKTKSGFAGKDYIPTYNPVYEDKEYVHRINPAYAEKDYVHQHSPVYGEKNLYRSLL